MPGHIVPCLLCGDPFLMRTYVGQPDQICSECKKTYADAAVVVCVNCDVVICRLRPKLLDNGYMIQPRSVLHSDGCNICVNGITESHLVEVTAWEKRMRPKKLILVPAKYANPRSLQGQ